MCFTTDHSGDPRFRRMSCTCNEEEVTYRATIEISPEELVAGRARNNLVPLLIEKERRFVEGIIDAIRKDMGIPV